MFRQMQLDIWVPYFVVAVHYEPQNAKPVTRYWNFNWTEPTEDGWVEKQAALLYTDVRNASPMTKEDAIALVESRQNWAKRNRVKLEVIEAIPYRQFLAADKPWKIVKLRPQWLETPAPAKKSPKKVAPVSPKIAQFPVARQPKAPAAVIAPASKKELKAAVLELLQLPDAKAAAKWAKRQGLTVDLCYKEHWQIVLQAAQDRKLAA